MGVDDFFPLGVCFGSCGEVAEVSVSCCNDDCHDCFGGGTLYDAAAAAGGCGEVAGGEVEELAEPVEDDCFKLCCGGGTQPVEVCGGEGGGVEFPEDAGVAGVCGEEGEEVGGLPGGLVRSWVEDNV